MSRLLPLSILAALLPFCELARAQLPLPEVPRTADVIVVDGNLDEAAWRKALRVPVNIETRPGENVPAPVRTTAMLLEDGSSLYVAFDAQDSAPSAIRAYLRNRDAAYQDDWVGIVLDTFNDQRRAFEFFVNPLGVQMDLTNDDLHQREDDSWDAIWSSAGRITDSGYIVEIEIPLSQLRFPRTDGRQTWGIDLVRNYPRGHRYQLRSNALDRAVSCYLCQLGKIRGFEGIESATDIEIVPTLTATQAGMRDDPDTDRFVTASPSVEPGLSLRWGITPDVTANLAINPDFSQVEADAAQADVNNLFALYYPEKRPFFLESADYFTTPIDAVFTRTIADPDVGAKLTGRRGQNTYGIFVANDRVTNFLFPGAYGSDDDSLEVANRALVARYSRNVGSVSSVGALVTGRQANGYSNVVGGIDGRFLLNDQNSVKVQVLRSTTEYPDELAAEYEQPSGKFSGNAVTMAYEYNARNWFGYLNHDAYDPNFRADSGFVSRVDYDKQTVGLGHVWHGAEKSWWKRMRLSGDWDITHDDSGQFLEREIEGKFVLLGPLQSRFELGGLTRKVFYEDQLFQENQVSLYAELNPLAGVRLALWTRYGDQVDYDNTRLGNMLRIEPSVDWNVNKHLMLKVRSTKLKLDSKEGPNIFDADVQDLRLTWQFNVRSFLRLTVQYQNIDRNQGLYEDDVDMHERSIGRQLLYSYKINPQTVFFLGYLDSLLTDDALGRLTTTERSVFLKIGYAWIP